MENQKLLGKRGGCQHVHEEPSAKKQKTENGAQLAQRTRPDKPDFAPLYKEHRKLLEAHGLKTDNMIALRRKIHTHPEGGFKEFVTQKLIKETLIGMGFKDKEIKTCAGTGLIVDVWGTGPKSTTGLTSVALRADMDGLPIPENNPHLTYKTTTDHAHMCGHDGHMATLISTAQVLHA